MIQDTDILHKFRKRLSALLKHAEAVGKLVKDLDYQRMLFARDLRALFIGGAVGDQQFMRACTEQLNIEPGEAKNLLVQANISEVVTDEKTLQILNPSKVKYICTLPKKEQLAVAELAKKETRSISNALVEYEVRQGKREAPPPRVNPREWATIFARYIKKNCTDIPKDIELGLNLYL